MVEQLQRIPAHGGRSQGARLLAAHKDKGTGGRLAGLATATPAYRGVGPAIAPPFSGALVPPSPAVQPMPTVPASREVALGTEVAKGGGNPDPYELPDDDMEEAAAALPGTASKSLGVTTGKRPEGPLHGGSEVKKQAHISSIFAQMMKKNSVARLLPAGMVNLGNTCYLNSVVQVLLNMPSFVSDLLDPSLERLRQHRPPLGVWTALLATVAKLRSAALARPTFDHRKPAMEPSELRSAMGRRGRRWRGFAQQDAHEFLVELLEGLQSEVLQAQAASTGRNRVLLSATRCPSARNLGGCLVHTYTCSACGRCASAKEPFSCLSLQLPPSGSVALQDLMAEYLKDETIEKNCDGCSPSAAVAHNVQHHLWRLPRVLVVHIKRFMPLPQQQQPQPQPVRQQQPEESRGDAVGGPAAAEAALAADDVHDGQAAQADVSSVPRTPPREASCGPQEQAPAAQGPASSAPTAPQPAKAPVSRESTPPAPYLYAKLHTVVDVSPGLDLSRHCHAKARAHVLLLEGVPPAALTRRTVEDVGGPAVNTNNGAGTLPSACSDGAAAAAARPQATPAGCTLDTAGGGSTCPSPSFMQPRSAMQERTVQQPGHPQRSQQPQRSRLGAGMTPGRLTGPCAPPESECGTSAISTGHQADGAPTPHGGKAPPSVLRHRNQDLDQACPATDLRGSAGGGGFSFGFVEDFGEGIRSCPPRAMMTPAVPRGKDGSLDIDQVSPVLQAPGRRQSNQTGNDDIGLFPQPGSVAREPGRSVGRLGITETAAAACSGRKGPKALAAGRFFGGSSAFPSSTPGGCMGDGGGGDDLVRPSKRVCMDDLQGPSSGRRGSDAAARGAAQAAPTPRRVEDMTEEEQLELALQMSLAGGSFSAGGAPNSPGRGNGSGGDGNGGGKRSGCGAALAGSGRPGSRVAVLDLSVPTAAARPGSDGVRGMAAKPHSRCASPSCDSSGDAVAGCAGRGVAVSTPERESPASCRGGGVCGGAEEGDDDVVELQDESPGGAGAGGENDGKRSGAGRRRGARPTDSDPAMSGASGSGGENDGGNDSDCVAEAADANDGGATTKRSLLDRRQLVRANRRYKRRNAHLVAFGVPEAAESPAVPPTRRRHTSDGAKEADGYLPVPQYNVEEDDDGTTAQSPVGGSRPAGGGGGGGRSTGPAPAGSPVDDGAVGADGRGAGADEDADFEEVLRRSMETFANEEAGRKMRASMEWEQVLSIPDADEEGDVAVQPAAQTACGTPHAGGMEALVAAAADLCGGGARGASADAAGDQDGSGSRSLPASLLKTGTGAATGGGAAGQDGFRFDFTVEHTGTGGAKGVIDLTGDGGGGDDEDAELNKAIMLSLQDQEWMGTGTDEGANNVVEVGADARAGSSGEGAEAAAPKSKVVIVADSDTEEDEAAGAAADAAPVAAGAAASLPPAAATLQVEAPAPKGGAAAPSGTGVPLAQLARYRLHGVVRHKGLTPFSGHYVADALVMTDGRQVWFEHNDSVVSQVDFSRVREDAAKQGYMLFFVNEATRAASGMTAGAVAAAAKIPLPGDSMVGVAKSA